MMEGDCETDCEFSALEVAVHRAESFPWRVFEEQVRLLEHELAEAGGSVEWLADQLHVMGNAMAAPEAFDQLFKTEEILGSMDDLVAAFVVILHARVAAVTSRAKRILKAARGEGIPVGEVDMSLVGTDEFWQLGNYIKHKDEDDRVRALYTNLDLYIAEIEEGSPVLHRWVVSEAVRRLGAADVTSEAMAVLRKQQLDNCTALVERVNTAFSPFVDALADARRKHIVKAWG
jgi:hypothetical protein